MWPSTSWPLSSLTRNIVLGRASVISPSISIFSSLAMRRGAYLTAQVLERTHAVRHFACILRGLQLGEGGAELGPWLDAEIGDGEQGDVDGNRFGRPEVGMDAPRRQRHLRDQEAEAEMVEGEALQVLGE